MFRRILILGWVFVAATICLLLVFPQSASRIPYFELFRPLLIGLTLATFGFLLLQLYLKGISRK